MPLFIFQTKLSSENIICMIDNVIAEINNRITNAYKDYTMIALQGHLCALVE